MLDERDWVLCAGTLGPVGVAELCEAAVAGGFAGITLWHQNVERSRAAGEPDEALRARIADQGLVVAEIDPLLTWLPGEDVPPEVGASEATLLGLAEAFGASSINAAQAGFGAAPSPDAAAEAFAGVCDRAGERGLRVHLEFLPWSGIADLAAALTIIELAGRANGALQIDTWHHFRSGGTCEALRTLAPDRVGSIQLNDAPTQPGSDIVLETVQARRLPGDGDIPLASWLAALDATGAHPTVGVEVFSRELQAQPPAEIGRRCGEAIRRVWAAARAARDPSA